MSPQAQEILNFSDGSIGCGHGLCNAAFALLVLATGNQLLLQPTFPQSPLTSAYRVIQIFRHDSHLNDEGKSFHAVFFPSQSICPSPSPPLPQVFLDTQLDCTGSAVLRLVSSFGPSTCLLCLFPWRRNLKLW